ncbi:uncharacterized protein FIESC28_03394 [Fusarium coffeatum]|uniref:Protein kinase domain-containing protein n=1 Tax=Fusarium coffeatum TaxID=231269 RepID=A0A366S4H4_9HYPO|nr:uncharacterized protein FIESC28_03394 [Fusarium coffeatum]RBR23778.1 hypothetical protein FIESC28_03394 [Fusarium coffeatum]
MTDKAPAITSWRHGTLALPAVDECDVHCDGRLKPSESDLSETVTPVTDLGRSATPNPFEGSFNRVWGNKDLSSRVWTVKSAQSLSIDIFRSRLFKRFSRNALDNSEYLPRDTFEQLFDMDSLIGLVKASFPKAKPEFQVRKVDEIMGVEGKDRRRKLYGILVAMNRISLMQDFVRESLCDEDLPFKESASDATHFTTQFERNSAASRQTEARQNTTLFQDWERNDFCLFYQYQQIFMVPYFDFQDINVCYYSFDRKVTLPWRKYERKTEGGEGTVHRVQIHPSHHNFKSSTGADESLYFALKELPSQNVDRFRQELEALQKNSQIQSEKHLIKLHLTFQHSDRFYLLFEWATSNLAEFWEDHPDIQVTAHITYWIALQCQGLARAVKRIHGLLTWQLEAQSSLQRNGMDNEKTRGRHGDIKPNNILWFEQREDDHNLLVLSDLGLTRYHSQLTNSLVSRIDGCTTTYRAPEVDMYRSISQSDRGREPYAEVKQGVHKMIEGLINEETCPEFISELLKFIRDRMLVVEAKDRAQIDEVCIEIARIMPRGSRDYQDFRSLFTIPTVLEDDNAHVDVQDNDLAFRNIGMEESLVMPVEKRSLDEEVAGPAFETQPRELYIPTLNLDLQERNNFRQNGYRR